MARKQVDDLRRGIKDGYDATGDYNTALIAIQAILGGASEKAKRELAFELGRLRTLECNIRLSSARNISDLKLVVEKAQDALDLLGVSGEARGNLVAALSSATLYLAVALKASGQSDSAIDVIVRAKRDLRRHFDTNYHDEILLEHQEVLIRQESKLFANLFDNVFSYIEDDPVEAYASVKRVFEAFLNKGMQSAARELLPLFKFLFRHVSGRLGTVARVSFQKNIGHYFLIENNRSAAKRVLERALQQAEAHGFSGQAIQIRSLLVDLNDGQDIILPTYKFL